MWILKFLGLLIDQQDLHTNLNFPTPKTTKDFKRLIGLIICYRRYLQNFALNSTRINELLHGREIDQLFWTSEAEQAFSEIQTRLTPAPILGSPDFSKLFVIQYDASDSGAGIVVYQVCDGAEHPVVYGSKSLVADKELIDVLFGIEKFRSYVEGTHFTVETGHSCVHCYG